MPYKLDLLLDTLPPDIGSNTLFRAISYQERAGSPVGWRAPIFVGECIFDTVGKTFYYGTDTTTANGWSAGSGGGGGGLVDGDYGDVSISGSGTTMTLDIVSSYGRTLIDDADAATARTTLGLGTAATEASGAFAAASHTHVQADVTGLTISDSPLFVGVSVGNADTTITRSAAGRLAVEGNIVYHQSGTDVIVADGGTGRSTHTAYAVICGGTTTTAAQQSIADVGTAGQVLTSNGAGALPTFQTLSSTGDPYGVTTTNNPASPFTLTTATGHHIDKITALADNLTINKAAGTATSGERAFRIVEIAATGADRTITWGTGITLGLGVAPSLVVPSGTTVRFVLYTDDGWTSALYDGDYALATETLAGRIEVATSGEINTGTDTGRAVAPDQLAASYAGTKSVSLALTSLVGDDQATGDGAAWFVVPAALNGMNLVGVVATVSTAGTTGTSDYQIRRVRAGTPADMLSTKLTVDSAETSSTTAATAAVIDTANDDVATGDLIYVDIDALSTTKPKGGAVGLEFRLP